MAERIRPVGHASSTNRQPLTWRRSSLRSLCTVTARRRLPHVRAARGELPHGIVTYSQSDCPARAHVWGEASRAQRGGWGIPLTDRSGFITTARRGRHRDGHGIWLGGSYPHLCIANEIGNAGIKLHMPGSAAWAPGAGSRGAANVVGTLLGNQFQGSGRARTGRRRLRGGEYESGEAGRDECGGAGEPAAGGEGETRQPQSVCSERGALAEGQSSRGSATPRC